jgi:hypothetical protein
MSLAIILDRPSFHQATNCNPGQLDVAELVAQSTSDPYAPPRPRARRCSAGDSAILVRDRRLGVRRVDRVLLDAPDEIERGVKRLVVLRIVH